jgi:hypothetical protein
VPARVLGDLLTALRGGRVRDAGALLVPAPRTAHAFFRASDPAPLAARAVALAAERLR